jgi:hypothetical protein
VRDVNIVDVFRRHAQAFKPLILVLPMSWEQPIAGAARSSCHRSRRAKNTPAAATESKSSLVLPPSAQPSGGGRIRRRQFLPHGRTPGTLGCRPSCPFRTTPQKNRPPRCYESPWVGVTPRRIRGGFAIASRFSPPSLSPYKPSASALIRATSSDALAFISEARIIEAFRRRARKSAIPVTRSQKTSEPRTEISGSARIVPVFRRPASTAMFISTVRRPD